MVFKLSGDLNRWGIGKIGRGLINSEKDKFWLDIPKNASQTTIHGLTNRHPNDGKWVPINSENFKVNSIQKYLIVRDPIQRWVGSSVELAWHHHKTKSEGNFFARKNLKEWYDMHARPDLHHLPQWVWARHLDLHDNTTFIIMDNKIIVWMIFFCITIIARIGVFVIGPPNCAFLISNDKISLVPAHTCK